MNKEKSSQNDAHTGTRFYKQQYRQAWEQLPDFKGWLRGVPEDKSRAYCAVCEKNLHAHRLTLLKHTTSIRHMKMAQKRFEEKTWEEENTKEGPEKDPEFLQIYVPTEGNDLQTDNCRTSDIEDNDLNITCEGNKDADKSTKTLNSEGDRSPSLLKQALVQTSTVKDISQNTNCGSQPVTPSGNDQMPKTVSARPSKPPISTHVLDTAKGLPVPGLQVSLYQLIDGRWAHIRDAVTNPDGRCSDLLDRESVKPGRFKLHFNTYRYFELRSQDCFFPFVEVVFDICSPSDHFHIPLLMTPYSYSVYRGS